jgi:predicted phosphodiesterase
LKLLLVSDIHNDYKTLDRHMATEADRYVAAGDLVSWSRDLDRAGEVLQRRAGKVYVLPGNHESEQQIAELCRKYGLVDQREMP